MNAKPKTIQTIPQDLPGLKIRTAAAAVLLAAAFMLSANGQNPVEPEFPAGIRVPDKVRGEAAIAALGNRLPEVAAYYGKSPRQLREIFRADRSLRVDPAGRLLFACELECVDCDHAHAEEDDNGAENIGPTDPSPYDTSKAFLLHSRPGANRVIYLDFDGHVDNTPGYWKDGAYAPPYNIPNSSASTFSPEERNRIIEIWQRVAEDFSMYDINVTTEEPDIEDLRRTSTSDARYGIRVCIGGSGLDWYGSGVGGVAFVGSFNAAQDVPCWVFPAGSGYTAKNIAEAASHEIGHTLGLFHDGIEGGAGYYSGHGNWGPIMGVSYTKPISQWSKGEYANANNTQDDLAVMLTRGAVYRPDDHGGTVATATDLTADSDTASAAGVIERSTDLDFLRINAAGGQLEVNVAPGPNGANLRLQVKLYDAGGVELQTATSADTSAGTQPVTLSRTVAAGIHFVSVEGIGNGTPDTGYSDYGSLGQYNVVVSGVVPGGFTWLPVAAGSYQWPSASNWAAGSAPAGAATTVRVNNDISGNQTIELTGPTTLGSLVLGDANSTHAFTIASSAGSMIFDNSGISSNLSKTTGSNDVISAPVSLADSLVLTQSASGTLSFTGGISGSGSLNKTGAGTLVFGTVNSYTGATTLTDGLLRLDNAGGLPGGIDYASGAGESTLFFKGGVLGLATGDFTRQLGTGAGQLNWNPSAEAGGAGSGGFAAFGADREVRLNNNTNILSWATQILGNGRILILSHPTATHTLNFRNNISFSTAKRTVQVEDGAAAVDAILSGVLAGSNTTAGLNKTGSGVLSLTRANTYPGTTTVGDGVLRLENSAALPSGNLELTGGGILGLGAGDFFNRTIGTGVDQVQWTGSGGFAAFGADRVVRFTPEPDTSVSSSINWTATNFIGSGRALILSHDTSDATIDWQQRISLAGTTRIIQVNDGSADIDAKMSGIVAGGSSGTGNRFNKTGPGTLAFTAQNSFWGNTIVSGGTLMIGDGGITGGVSMNSSEIIVEAGATLAVNRSNTVTQGSNPFAAPVTGEGGFAQIGAGNTVLMLANTYIGPTRIDAGTLTLGAAGVLPGGTEVVIGNATLDAGSVAETVGRLDIEGQANIHLGAGASLAFADSSSVDWTGGTLGLTGSFVSGSSLRFGTNGNGLTPSQLALVSINGNSGHLALDAAGYLVSGYAAWVLTQAPNTGNDPGADEDDDGVANGAEYVLGGSIQTGDSARLPQISISGGNMLFSFNRDQASIDGTTIVEIETSPSLADWTNSYAVPDEAVANSPGVSVVKDSSPGYDTVTLALPVSPELLKSFARLKITFAD